MEWCVLSDLADNMLSILHERGKTVALKCTADGLLAENKLEEDAD